MAKDTPVFDTNNGQCFASGYKPEFSCAFGVSSQKKRLCYCHGEGTTTTTIRDELLKKTTKLPTLLEAYEQAEEQNKHDLNDLARRVFGETARN